MKIQFLQVKCLGRVGENMNLLRKYIRKQILSDKVFVALLGVLTVLTAVSYFFVKFSIDGNLAYLNSLDTLADNQILYQNALISNTSLANIFLLSTEGLTACVFGMFYYRIIRANQAMVGMIKALGFKDREIVRGYIEFSMFLTVIGSIFGIGLGYLMADVLIVSNQNNYQVENLVKSINVVSIIIGVIIPIMVNCFITYITFLMIKGKEAGNLIAGKKQYKKQGIAFKVAEKIVNLIPTKEKFPYRIALRKPIAMIIIVVGIMVFNVFVILGCSLYANGQQMMLEQGNAGSFNVSAMICQVSVILSGVILLFLALFLNFQDNKRDMQILRMMGHNDREIQGIFVNVYWKILMFVFVISMPVSLIIAKLVQVSLEQAIEEKMPFTFNVGVILLLVALLNIIYVLVKSIFSYQVRKIKLNYSQVSRHDY